MKRTLPVSYQFKPKLTTKSQLLLDFRADSRRSNRHSHYFWYFF